MIHIVKKGETLYSIASKYGMTVEGLKAINGLSGPVEARVGQRLIVNNYINIPSVGTGTGSGVVPGSILVPDTYTIRAGDTLGAIAQRFGTTVANL